MTMHCACNIREKECDYPDCCAGKKAAKITNEIALGVRKFVSENHGRRPDRLIINHYQLHELRANRYTLYFHECCPAGFGTFMGMRIITAGVELEDGFEIR